MCMCACVHDMHVSGLQRTGCPVYFQVLFHCVKSQLFPKSVRVYLYACTIILEIFTIKIFLSLVASMKIKTNKNFKTANLISTLKLHGCLGGCKLGCLIPISCLQNSSSLIVGAK